MIAMMPVHSSNVRAIGYESGTLVVAFHGGGKYAYLGVPESVYQSFMSAFSKGGFFADHIKDRYSYERVR